MFKKIQSYVTPILLSYVDKYIKDFKAEDTQVSLWSGSVSLHNLELRPDVIQQELNIPFTLSSGHIHELLIQVPWMKIVSEPIIITINTIECVLKLNDGKQSPPTAARTNKNNEDLDAPPGYVQSLANRIVSNIAFRCNNVILKYVEEDIVISINIKQFYLDNVDGNWVPTFAEITPDDLHTRKLIRLGDLTLCLDKRNAAGKIETYLEPLLYKCEMEFRLDSTYGGVLNKRPKNTRIFINSPKLEFNFSYQQIPMILRIIALFKALKQKRLNVIENAEASHDMRFSTSKTASLLHEVSTTSDGVVDNESWSGWMWSFVQPFPLGYSEEEQDTSMNASAIILFSINFESVSFSFKTPDFVPDASGIYNNPRKLRYTNICSLELTSVICETSSHGLTRFRFRGGVKKIMLYPENSCPCGIPDHTSPDVEKKMYFETIINSNNDVDDEEAQCWPIEYDSQSIVDTIKDSDMLAICPAFAVDYLYYLTLPDDFKDNMSIGSDLEYSNLKEDLSVNIVFGPSNINICAGAIHRLSLLKTAADTYDYAPYYTVKPLTKRQDLLPPSTDDYDAFIEHIPKINLKITAVKPKIHVALWDHYASVKIPGTTEPGATTIGRRKTSSNMDHSIALYEKLKNMPSVMFVAETLKATISKPMYPNRLTYVTCQFPDPPVIMLDSCYEHKNFEANTLECFLVHRLKTEKLPRKSSIITSGDQNKKLNEVLTPFVTQCNFQISGKTLLLDEYWETNNSILHNDYNYNMENITICGSMAKIIAGYHILSGTLPQSELSNNQTNDDKSHALYPKDISVLLKTTLLKDAFGDNEMVHLDLNFEGLSIRSIHMKNIKTHRIVLNGVKIFAIDPSKDLGDSVNVNQVWIISAPESSSSLSSPFLKAVLQLSACELYSTFFTLKLEEWSFVMDPLFCNWLTYRYQKVPENVKSAKTAENPSGVAGNLPTTLVKRQSRRSLEEIVNRIGGSSRNLNRLSLGQSSSDREKDYVHAPMQVSSQTNVEKPKEKLPTSQEKLSTSTASSYFNKIIQRYFKWKNIAIYLEIETVCVYFPTQPVSALNYDSVNDAIQGSILNNDNLSDGVLVLRLPNVIFKSSTLKQNLLCFCIHGLPAKLPADVWDYERISYPLSVSLKNLNCYTLSVDRVDQTKTVVQTNILKPLSLDITISFTSKKPVKPKTQSNPDIVDSAKGKQKKVAVEKENNASNKTTINKATELKRKSAGESELLETVKTVNNPQNEDLSSIGVCIHIDTEFVKASINENQMILLNGIVHGIGELIDILSVPNADTRKNTEIISINAPSSSDNEKIQNVHAVDVNEIISKNLPEESLSKDSDLPESSNDMPEVIKKDVKVIDNDNAGSQNDSFYVSIWFQWTISRMSLKAYSQIAGDQIDKNKYLKMVFTAEDFVSSLDIQKVYFKWQTKVVTASIHHYKRTHCTEPWMAGDFSGVIMKGRENSKRLKSAAENCFLFIHVTKAKSTSIHNKWQDNCKKSTQNFSAATEYLSEIEVSLQELDVILNLRSLKPFSYLISSLLIPVECHGDANTDGDNKYGESASCAVAKYWDSRKLPLYYFEVHHPRIIIPIVEISNTKNEDNVVIIQMDKISLSPVVDNPVCRSPLRPDLYQQAAAKGYLYIPGSELEDRQFQFLVKGISIHTAQWIHLEKSFCLESQPMLSENPALQWNNSALKLSNTLPIMSIVERVDVCLVIALAIFSQTEMICGPTIDFNVLNDIEMYLSTVQIQLLMMLVDEVNMVFNNLPGNNNPKNIDDEKTNKLPYVICPYQKYINRIYKDLREYCMERNTPALSTDTGIASDMMSNNTGTSKGSVRDVLKPVPVFKISERSSQADYYDILFTFGKISLNLFEKLDGDVSASPKNKAESESDDKSNTFLTKPLLYGILVQPNFSYSRCHFVTKFQFSIFHFSISLGDEFLHNGLPKPNDFLTAVLETKLGVPDSVSDIYPNFMTVQWEKSTGKKQSMKIDVKCPIRITASLDRVEKFNKIIKLLSRESSNINKFADDKSSISKSKDHFLKKFLDSHHVINISMTQVVFAMIVQDDIDFEFLVSFSSYKHSIGFNSRPEKISNLGILDSLVVSLRKTDDRQSKILINPWTIGFEINILWESWRNTDTINVNPLVRIFLETDRLLIELSSEHITILQGILNYWTKNEEKIKSMMCQFVENKEITVNEHQSPRKNQFWNQMSPNDQHYKDDLRAGAFKFIHGGVGKPLPYQVFISSRGLMWRYPQPRSITRVHSFPVPFQLIYGDELNTSNDVSVCCTLEYYSDVTDSFQYYAKFYIKQDQRVKLDQTKFDHRVVLSAIWRVVMHVKEEDIVNDRLKNKQTYFNKKRFDLNDNSVNENVSENDKMVFPIKPLALAACLRIDSYFTPHLVPSAQFTAKVSLIEVNLINHPRNRPLPALSDTLRQYNFNKKLQPSYVFCSIVLSSSCLQTSIWNENIALYKIDTDVRFDVIDGSDMLLDKVIELNDVSLVFCKGENDDEINTLIHTNKIALRGGPQHIHTLISSYQIWKDILLTPDSFSSIENPSNCQKCIRAKPDMLIPRYFICNDTNLTLGYGQVGMEENIVLLSGACHLYSWKTSCVDEQLLLTINLGLWKSPKGFQIEKAGLSVLKLTHENSPNPVKIIVLVEVVSPVQRCVTLMGQLIIFNTLPTDLSLKLYHKKVLQLHGVSASSTVEINKKKRSSSLLVNIDTDSTIRLRFAEIESGWSGDIPLKECAKGNMPWLVKVPDQGNIQYISIWCRIIKDNVYGRTLVVLSPLYVIKSHLPMKMEINLHSDKQDIMHSLGGRGSSSFVMCPGTTSTKHEITIKDLKTGQFSDSDKIPLSYELIDQTTFFPSKEENTDIDKILNDIKQWLNSEQSYDSDWPYIFPEDGINWIPIAHQHRTDIVVRYLNAVKGVESVIVDLAPWALLGNCSGVTLHLLNSTDEDLCMINHRHVLIPPPIIFKEPFYSRITVGDRSFKSGPLSVNTTALGPYERKTAGRVSLEGDSIFCVDCDDSIYIFSMAYEIIENINIFRMASKYVFVNKLACDVMVLPIALHNTSQSYTGIPSNAVDISIMCTSNDNSNTGIPINRFNILQKSSDKGSADNEESYNLFICISLSKNDIYSCPVRIDKFIQRRSIAIKSDNTSIPVVITCQEYRGQVFITVHKDPSPQFLIQNNANMPIAIAQVLRESVTSDLYNFHYGEELVPHMVVQECWRSAWHCVISPSHETFYTMPTQNSQYPELFQTTSLSGASNNSENLYLTFACLKDYDNEKYSWSVPVVVSTNNLEQFVKLPGFTGDIKVMVKNHCHTTLITVNNVTEDDISASDIRKRLLINNPREDDRDEESSDDDVVSLSVEALLAINTNTREVNIKSYSDDIKSFITNVADRRIVESGDNDVANIQTFKGYTKTKILGYCKISFICDNMQMVLTNCNNVDVYSKVDDLVSLICDRVVIVSSPTQKGFTISLKIGDLQVDNPLYPRGGYDFHVVLVKQPSIPTKNVVYYDYKSSILSQISNISDVIEELGKDCFVSCVNDIETWSDHSTLYLGCNDIHITISPISTYFEDTYISTLLDYATDLVPAGVPAICNHTKYFDDEIHTADIIEVSSDITVPEFIIWEAYTVAHPIRLNRLLIEPLNILLSVHSSMLFYLALDHSPLQFAKFERVNVLTSSFRLGRAVTMHYLSEAIFGAGWVVGSLEILGSPGGLARKVTAGLRDLVREPCLGLMRGPWGFLVGMTHGSASLLKHLTQGTVESMSMVMGSVARNLDRLSLDDEHIQRTERARRHRPQGILPALSRGFQGLGLSLLGAIGGIAHEALIAGYEQRKGPTAVAAGLTRGLVGVITKPLSATADLLALTGQGLLHQAGWDKHPFPRWICPQREVITLRNENFRLKLGDVFSDSSLLFICQGVDKDSGKDVSLVISNRWLIILDTNNDEVFAMFELEAWKVIKCNYKNGMLVLGLNKPNSAKSANYPSSSKMEAEVQMDPALRARIAAYVGVVEETHSEVVVFRFVFPNQYANHCATMVNFARLHSLNQGFPVF